jgi:Kef-type K+ transport system membrane component KefB
VNKGKRVVNWFSLKRWVEVATYALLASFFAKLILIALISVVPTAFADAFVTPSNHWQWLSPISVWFIILIWLHWTIGFRFRQLANSLKYPSLAVAVGLALFFGFEGSFSAPEWLGPTHAFWGLSDRCATTP